MAFISLKEAALGGFVLGVVGLSMSLSSGGLNDLKEYEYCHKILNYQHCYTRFHKINSKQPTEGKLVNFHKGYSSTKIAWICLSLLTLPVATIAARKHAQDCEASAVMQQLNMQTEYKLEEQKQEVANEKELSAYSAMQEMKYSDMVAQFEKQFYETPTYEEMDATIEAERNRLAQYKQLEGNAPTADSEPQNQVEISQSAKSFLDYLIDRNHQEITVSKAAKNKGMKHDEVRALMQELHQAEKGVFDEASSTFKLNSDEN